MIILIYYVLVGSIPENDSEKGEKPRNGVILCKIPISRSFGTCCVIHPFQTGTNMSEIISVVLFLRDKGEEAQPETFRPN